MSEIVIADDLAESELTVADAVCVDDAELVTTDGHDDQPTLAEWST